MSNCIVAIATPPFNSAYHIIRASGKDTFTILEKTFNIHIEINNKKPLLLQTPEFTIYLFKEPYSYTGENMFEIHLWGNYFQAHNILAKLIENGARLAKEGEFTQIAFLNGKKNFLELEHLASLFESETADVINITESILDSKRIENKLKEIYDALLNLISDLEATWDFVEHDIPQPEMAKLLKDLENIYSTLNTEFKNLHPFNDTFSCRLAIWGLPNVGKSFIFKRLTGYNSLITPVAGTTRDIISASKTYNNITFTFLDLPGYNVIFRNDIEKYSQQLINSIFPRLSGIIYVFDLSIPPMDAEWECYQKVHDKVVLCIGNKADIINPGKINFLLRNINKKFIIVSALKNKGFGKLLNALYSVINNSKLLSGYAPISTRQFNLLEEIKSSVERALNEFRNNQPPDLIVDELKYSIINLESLLGIRVEEDILKNIMSKFCIGK